MLFHIVKNLSHRTKGCFFSCDKDDIQPDTLFKTRHKEAISLPYNTSRAGTVMRFAYFCGGGYTDTVFTQPVINGIGDQS